MNTKDKAEFKQLILSTLFDFWETVSPNLATKQDLKGVENKVDGLEHKVDGLEHKVDILSRDVKEIRRRVIDLEIDTPTKSEFNALKNKVSDLTN